MRGPSINPHATHMLSRLHQIREPWRMLLIGVLTLATLMASQAWPNLAVAVWAVFLSFIAAVLCADFVGVRAQPVNYESIHISGGTIEYLAFGQKSVIRLNEVTRLEFVREEALFPDIDGPYIESKWLLQSHDGPRIEVMDEWPHRKQLLQAFREHLPHFDEEAARAGLKARGEGRWLCYQASRTGEGDV